MDKATNLVSDNEVHHFPTGPIHHVAVKTRNITTAIQFYSLLGLEPTVKFRAGPARAAWLEHRSNFSVSATPRLELIEVPTFLLNEPEGRTIRSVDLMKRPELLGYNHIALDVTEAVSRLATENTNSSLIDWMRHVNDHSLKLFGKTLRVALEPRQQMIGETVYELVSRFISLHFLGSDLKSQFVLVCAQAFIYDADGALVELIRKQSVLSQKVVSGWEPWDGKGFQNL
jgi:catechol 2,3-dioxygenase-like lactoylglutathione lyase family enzyme